MYSNSFTTNLTMAARLTTHIKTLIDNIFDSNTNENVIAGNLTSPISDHLAQFLVYTEKSHRIKKSKQIRFKGNPKI